MSLNLTFYSISWKDIESLIGSKNQKLFSDVLKEIEPEYTEIFGPNSYGGGPDFEQGLERWFNGSVVGQHDLSVSDVTNFGDKLSFMGMVQYFGKYIGTMSTTSGSAIVFEEFFLGDAAQQLLQLPFPLEYLISRPILGYESGDMPLWGGLSSIELAAIAPRLEDDAPSWPADPDIDEWILDLWDNLGSGVDLGKDLVTFYE